MSNENKQQLKKLQSYIPALLLVIFVAYLIASKWDVAQYVIIALFGFGAVVFIHEFGHFIVARFCDIEIETFAIGFAIGTPFLFGIKRIENGYRIRILPKTSGIKEDPEGDCLHMFTIPAKCKTGETEYCIGPLPLGGFVKMLGQDDSGPVEVTDNPRSFANKTVYQRMAVIAAGVTFNVIGAFLIFLFVSLAGFKKIPAVVGGVLPGLPAQKAGLEYGDRIVEIDGKSMSVDGKDNLDFSHIMRAAIFSDKTTPTKMKVRRSGDPEFEVSMIPVTHPGSRFPIFGIDQMETLQILPAKLLDKEYAKELGVSGGEEITALNGNLLKNSKTYKDTLRKLSKEVTKNYIFTYKKTDPKTGEVVDGKFTIPSVVYANYTPKTGATKTAIDASAFGLLPRIKVFMYSDPRPQNIFSKIIAKFRKEKAEPKIKSGDIIVKIGSVEYPSFTQLRTEVQKYASKKKIPVALLRRDLQGQNQRIEVEVPVYQKKSKSSSDVIPAKMGVVLEYDMASPIVAQAINSDMPKNSTIVSIDGEEVRDFFDIANKIIKLKGQRVPVVYYDGKVNNAGSIALDIPNTDDCVTLESQMRYQLPFTRLQRLYKVSGIASASKLSVYLIGDTLGQSLETLKKLLSKAFMPKTEDEIGTDDLMGPVGIATISYKLIKIEGITKFIYFMGMISCFLAVMNILPIPVVDGGHLVLLVIEKIKGSPVSMLAQQILTYTGLALLGLLFIWITYNDILRSMGLH